MTPPVRGVNGLVVGPLPGRYLSDAELRSLLVGRTAYLEAYGVGGPGQRFANYHAPDGTLYAEGSTLDYMRYRIADGLCLAHHTTACYRYRETPSGEIITLSPAGYNEARVLRTVAGDPQRLASRAPPVARANAEAELRRRQEREELAAERRAEECRYQRSLGRSGC
jgi:hypothetical protein